MTPGSPRLVSRRRSLFINPRIQGGAAVCLTAAILVVAVLFAWRFHLSAGKSLLAASFHGHYEFRTPYEIVGKDAVETLGMLFLATSALCLLVFLCLLWRIRTGVNRLIKSLRISAEGDLSSPTPPGGQRDLASLAAKLDAVRSGTLARIEALRAETEALRNEPLPDDEFDRRWEALKRALRTVAP